MENEIIEKIKTNLSKITNLSSFDIYFKLDTYVDNILENILELIKLTEDENKKHEYRYIWKNLDYRNERDVMDAKLAYNKARKKNAPKKREVEYSTILKKVIRLIEIDLSHFRN